MNKTLKNFLNNLFASFGLEIRKVRKPFKYQIDLMNQFCNDPPIIFDVGAHIGNATARYRELSRKAMIYSFEPSPDTFLEIKNRFADDARIYPIEKAVSDLPGAMPFYIYESSVLNSLLKSSLDPSMVEMKVEKPVEHEVEVTTLDIFAKENNINQIDLLKLDVQGNELKVLEGASNLLGEDRIKVVYTEVNFCDLYEDQTMYYQIAEKLHHHGFYTFGLYDVVYCDVPYVLGWADMMFVKK